MMMSFQTSSLSPLCGFKQQEIAGFPVIDTTAQHLAKSLQHCFQEQHATTLFFANTNFIVKSRHLLEKIEALQEESNHTLLIANDGVGMDIAAKLLHGCPFAENLNGTDFTPYLLQQINLLCHQTQARPLRVYLLGARPAVVRRAAEFASCQYGIQIVGCTDGYAGMNNHQHLLVEINQSQADVLLVALGNPVQEQWILQYRTNLQVSMVLGVGALFDFWAGDKPRAPRWVQRLRLEWLFRLSLEPRRLLRRYTFDILVFLKHCYRYR